MIYAIIFETDTKMEMRIDIPGTVELEKFTNDRIFNIYPVGKTMPITIGEITIMATVKYVYKVYANSRCTVLAS